MLKKRQKMLSIIMLLCIVISAMSVFAFSDTANGRLVEKLKGADLKLREKGHEIVERNVTIVMFGIDWKKGCLEVVLREVKQEYVEIIKTVVGNVPVEFYKGELYLDINKTEKFRPAKGGIRVQTHVHPYIYSHTLGFAARHADKTLGIVITGHAGGVGTHVYQPVVASHDFVGTIAINNMTNRWSDSAWVPINNTCGHIYYNRTIIGTRTLAVGDSVAMEGITSCGTTGHVHAVNRTIYDPGRGIYIYGQVVATYPSQPGDSGGPVTHPGPEPNQVSIYAAFM